LALNGYDGDKLIIYDPWGRVYTVSMDSIFYGRQGSNAVFADPRTRVIYGNYKTRTWDNFNHYVTGSGEQKTQTLLTHRIKFRVSQP
jgi:hypothetical protein